jgi:TfoX/Sxy family transcriptional regulator of competence genes
MPTSKETAEFILGKLRHPDRILVKRMFGEFSLYADGKMVAVICDDRLYVKIAPASKELEDQCEKGEPYLKPFTTKPAALCPFKMSRRTGSPKCKRILRPERQLPNYLPLYA